VISPDSRNASRLWHDRALTPAARLRSANAAKIGAHSRHFAVSAYDRMTCDIKAGATMANKTITGVLLALVAALLASPALAQKQVAPATPYKAVAVVPPTDMSDPALIALRGV
jgi:hypothetical protein